MDEKILMSLIGKVISDATFDKAKGIITLEFQGGEKVNIYDQAQQCCEKRFMTTDDNIKDLIGSKLVNIELSDSITDGLSDYDYNYEECQFLRIITASGLFTAEAHNIHNGYYSGFDIVIDANIA